NILDAPMPALELIDDALEQRGSALVVALADAALADILEQLHGQGRLGIDRSSGCSVGFCDLRKRCSWFIGVPQATSLLDDPRRLDRGEAARLLLDAGEIRGSGDAVGLHDDAGILVGA